jgi:hypothetical protein
VSQPKDSTEFTVRFTKAAYLVLDPDERMAEKRHQLAALAAQTEGQRPHDFTGVAL